VTHIIYLIVLDMSAFVDFAVSPVAAALVGFLVSSPNAADSANNFAFAGHRRVQQCISCDHLWYAACHASNAALRLVR
jgi:hypothetical protein